MVVKPETALVRPFVVCAVLRGVKLDQARYNSFIDLQDKVCLCGGEAEGRTAQADGGGVEKGGKCPPLPRGVAVQQLRAGCSCLLRTPSWQHLLTASLRWSVDSW
eukprot:354441-Chlamydomonas_euryale.AAC.1